MSVTSVTPASESMSNKRTTLHARISSSPRVGTTAVKQRTNRSSCSDISNLHDAMKQGRSLGVKRTSPNGQSRPRRPFQQFCKEILDRPIARSHFIVEDDLVGVELVEQVFQALMLNAAGECPAAHDPTTHVHLAASCFAHDDCDLAQRAIFVLI